MAFGLLVGTAAAIDVSFGTSPISMKCIFGRWRATINAQTLGQTTFCSGSWISEAIGMKQMSVDLSGYASVGNTYSDPLALFAAAPVAGVLTANTATTLTGSFNPVSDATEMVAAANSGRDISLRSTGAVTSVWPIT